MNDIFECAFREMQRRKRRTILSITGYILTVFICIVLVTVITFSNSAESFLLHNIGTHFIAFIPSSQDKIQTATDNGDICCPPQPMHPLEGFVSGDTFTSLVSIQLVEEAKKIESISDVSPFLLFKIFDDDAGKIYTIGGFDPSNTVSVYNSMGSPSNMVSGHYIKPTDLNTVMVHDTYAREKGLSVGDSIMISGESFKIAGIIKPPLRPVEASIYMTYDEAGRVINKRMTSSINVRDFNILLIKVETASVQKDAIQSIKNLMNLEETVISSYGCYVPASKTMAVNQSSAWILLVILAVGLVIFSVKSQITATMERRHDISILKLIGWVNGKIVWQIIIESVVQALIGAVLGSVLAVMTLLFVPLGRLLRFDGLVNVTISWPVLILTFLVALSSGIVASIIPALKVAHQKPAEELRKL